MRWLLNRLLGWLAAASSPGLACDATVWAAGVRELGRRTLGGRRESGAFLLGVAEKAGTRRVLEFVFYDDVDPRALDTGIVHFDGIKLPRLWEHCRRRGYGVVADVHVHPFGFGQSQSDKDDPVMPRAGHVAVIVPHFAQRGTGPGEVGVYEYLGNGDWRDRTPEGDQFFRLEAR